MGERKERFGAARRDRLEEEEVPHRLCIRQRQGGWTGVPGFTEHDIHRVSLGNLAR